MNHEPIAEPYRAEQRFQGIFDHAIEGIFQTTPDGHYAGANPALARIYGYDSPEDLQAHLSDIRHQLYVDERRRDQFQQLMEEHGRVTNFESAIYRKDGSIIWISENAVAVHDEAGGLLHYEGFVVDITARRLAEEALQKAREELEMRVAERTSELEQANASLQQIAADLRQARDDAERATRAKNEFLSRMSHELRTPLNAILGFAQLLDRPDLQAVQRERIGHIYRAGRHLLELINEVLDIARIESGRMELSLEPVRVCEAFQEVISLLRPLAAQRNVELICEAEQLEAAFALADRQRFKQVLLNLVGNAIKYHREGGGTVRLSAMPVPAERLRVLVIDDGPGISAEKIDRLFVPFDRLGVEGSEVQGTGLGLALSKRLTEAMGGSLGAESSEGEGSTFWVKLPRAQSPLARAVTQGSTPATALYPPAQGGSWKVLYVEDNLANLNLLEHVLAEHSGVELLSAMQGRVGLDLAREHRPDLILLDLHLPDLPGREVLLQLKSDPLTRAIPVVVMSADATGPQIERLRAAGAADYLTKPLDLSLFLKVLNQYLTTVRSDTAHA
ncbi:MAG TPA: ATP-binding protein [Chthoniobacteraceae bacterium]|jgi:PAS domain S-box-containing protein